MLSVIVPTYRQPERLALTLRNVAGACVHEDVAAEIVIVDDGDDEQVSGMVAEVRSRTSAIPVRYLRGGHGGRSCSRNRGAAMAEGERLLFLDGDMLLDRGAISSHARAEATDNRILGRGKVLRMPWMVAFQDPGTGTWSETARESLAGLSESARLAGRRVVLDEQGYPSTSMSRWARRNRFERDIQGWFANGAASGGRWLGVVGAHFSISHEMFDKVGKFDEAMGRRWGAEDLEFGLRAERGGIPIVAVEAVAYHMDHDTAGRDGDHRSAIEYLAQKHGRPELLGLWDYFEGRLPFSTLVTL